MSTALIRPDELHAWSGPSLLIVNTRGECRAADALSGYYCRETRFASSLELEINGCRPWLCEAARTGPRSLCFTFAHPEVAEYGGGGSGQAGDDAPRDDRGIPQRALAIRLVYTVSVDGLTVDVEVANHSTEDVPCVVAWAVDADFADIQEAQEGRRRQRADIERLVGDRALVLHYGHDELRYRCAFAADGDAEWTVTTSAISGRFTLAAQQRRGLTLRLEPSAADATRPPANAGAREARRREWESGFTRVGMPLNAVAEQIFTSNVRDLASFPLLDGAPDEWLTLQAGVPLYPAVFGRDTLTAGWQAAFLDRGQSLDASLTYLGRLQGRAVDDWRDEEPGRLPYQVRRGPLELLNLTPYAAYYADFASPFMYVIALAHLFSWSGKLDRVRAHWDTARRIMDWARTHGDRDGDGYLEYQTRSSKGTKNQGWKDSGDAIVYPDGTPVPPPLGTCELQGYWFAAQQLMAVLSWAMGARGDARAYWRSAMALKKRFNRDWWIDGDSSFALALDPDKRPVAAVSSNIGHCIATGIVNDQHLPAAVERLFAPDMFSGWGIRTLSTTHRSYSPMSYHCGSVWAVEQATIAFGLRRFGFDAEALRLTRALFDLAQLYPGFRIPECIGGYARDEWPTPSAYPRANAPQLWNASTFPLLLHTVLGLQPVAPLELLVLYPRLPDWLPEVVLEDLRIADATVTLRFRRDADGRSRFDVLRQEGTLRIVEQPPLESLSATTGIRFKALARSVLRRASTASPGSLR